jgi:cytidine deaminase
VALTQQARFKRLREAALGARSACYARYSGFGVLAAVERIDGRVYGGANVEIVNYTLTKHAEEAAALAAIADGALELGDRWLMAVYTQGAPPCGSCRQFLWEWATPTALSFVELPGEEGYKRPKRLSTLYPEPFEPSALPDRRKTPRGRRVHR